MPEETAPPTPAALAPVPASDPTNIPPAVGATPAVDPPADPDLGDAGKRALAAERTARRASDKAATDAQTALKVYQDRDLSEIERAQNEAVESKAAATKAIGDALRWRTAAHHGISDADAELFLTGTDEVTLTAQAERFAELSKTPAGPRTPAPDPGQGPRTPGPQSEDDVLYESLYGPTPVRK